MWSRLAARVAVSALKTGMRKLLAPLAVKGGIVLSLILLVLLAMAGLFEAAGAFLAGNDAEARVRKDLQSRYQKAAVSTVKGMDQQPYMVPWGLLMALDRLANGFKRPEIMGNSEELKPRFTTHQSLIKTTRIVTKTDKKGNSYTTTEITEEKVDLIDTVDTYRGWYRYIYKRVRRQGPPGVTVEKEELVRIDHDEDYQRLETLLEKLGLSPKKDLELVIALGKQFEGESPELDWTLEADHLYKSLPGGDGGPITGEPSALGLIWPTPGYFRVTSSYGWRVHPVSGKWKMHTGLDIGAPMDARVVAVKDGTVLVSGRMNGYGNVVVLDHGNGLTSLFAHLNERLVNKGDTVKSGEIIALVGSTGRSTGPHLHFEVRVQGKHHNPQDYIESR